MGYRRVHIGVWWENLNEGDHLENPDVDWMILKWIFEKWYGGMDCINLAQEGTGGGLW